MASREVDLLLPRHIDDQLTAKPNDAIVDDQYLGWIQDVRSDPAPNVLRRHIVGATFERRIDLLSQDRVKVIADAARASMEDLVQCAKVGLE
jgi:hypothetical protein